MSSIVFKFKRNQDTNQLRQALEYAIGETDSSFVLDNGEPVLTDWFSIYPDSISIYEIAMSPDDIETAHLRLSDALINMVPNADFSSRALYWERVSGYEKAFRIFYNNGKKYGFDAEGIPGACCPECDESLMCCTDEQYEIGKTYRCSCGYEYDPLDNPDCGVVEKYDSLDIEEIPALKSVSTDDGITQKEKLSKLASIDFEGKIFVSTGLSLEEESWAREQIESRGGIMKRKFVVSLNYLIYNPDYDHETIKLTRAKEQIEKGKPVQIISFEQFKELL